MGHHTFDPEKADRLEDAARRYRYLSMEELVGALKPSNDAVVADLGSGTGFYADDVARFVGKVYAVDVQDEMHAHYREKGVPENVELVTAEISDTPFETDALDAAYTTMTYHEFASEDALDEVRRVLKQDARFVVADWSSRGSGEVGPTTDERYSKDDAVSALEDAGFDVERADERTETFVLLARTQ
ncbi:MAG: class I SAM-dependent methyltransferase [Halobacteriales archaeon]|nr:class I SAM-dependent methyltransferase [Halobacteriales archaeon]